MTSHALWQLILLSLRGQNVLEWTTKQLWAFSKSVIRNTKIKASLSMKTHFFNEMWTFWTITWWIRVCYHVCVSVGLLTWKCLWFLRDTPEGVECFCPALLLWLVVRVNNVEWLEEIPLCKFKAFTQSHHTYRAHIQVSRNACSYTTQYHISGTPMQTLAEKY